MNLYIDDKFDSGNIQLNSIEGTEIRLEIRPDEGGEHMQWFHFRLDGAMGSPCTLRIVNAAKTSYPHAWENYHVCSSSDRDTWERVHTRYENGELIIEHTPDSNAQSYAYFAPYSHEQHLDLLAYCEATGLADISRLGTTLDGRAMHKVSAGTGPLTYWIIGRQHPGETMASWWMEGFMDRLLSPTDSMARVLREKATVHVVPHMNLDGGIRGHLRTNAVGANLNREWDTPTLERSPEVYYTLESMRETGMHFCLDVHGDEALPYVFLSGPEGIVGYEDTHIPGQCELFGKAYEGANPDLQRIHGYPLTPRGKANMSMCTNAVAGEFQCPAYTLEMPFKDNDNAPDPHQGWSPDRCAELGRSVVDALVALAREQQK